MEWEMGMKRVYSLDVLKLVLAYCIAFFHFGTEVAPGPTVAVQVFFMISGFFLARKFYSRSYPDGGYSAWDYTWDHAKAIYPHYLLSLAVWFLYMLARSVWELVKAPDWAGLLVILKDIYYQIHESYNYPLWQLSALMIAGYFVYALLCHNEKLSRQILFPAAILMIQSLLNTGVDLWENYGPLYIPLLRAFSPLCIGVLAYYFTTTKLYEAWRAHPVGLNLMALVGLAGIFLFGDAANIFLLTTPFLLWGCWEKDSWLNRLLDRRVFRWCGNFSYAVYLNHALIGRFLQARVLPRLGWERWMENGLYFLLLTGCSVLSLALVKRWKGRRKVSV